MVDEANSRHSLNLLHVRKGILLCLEREFGMYYMVRDFSDPTNSNW